MTDPNHIWEIKDTEKALSRVLRDSLDKWDTKSHTSPLVHFGHFRDFYGTNCPICSCFTVFEGGEEVVHCEKCPLYRPLADDHICYHSSQPIEEIIRLSGRPHNAAFWRYYFAMKRLQSDDLDDRDRYDTREEAESAARRLYMAIWYLTPGALHPLPNSLFFIGPPV